MSVFTKSGIELKYPVLVPGDPKVDPTYSYKFPTLQGTRIVEKWARKVRPIKDLTHLLRGCQLRKYHDYVVEYGDIKADHYTYWFADSKQALMFQIAASCVKQGVQAPGHKFDIQCPHCQHTFPTEKITWV